MNECFTFIPLVVVLNELGTNINALFWIWLWSSCFNVLNSFDHNKQSQLAITCWPLVKTNASLRLISRSIVCFPNIISIANIYPTTQTKRKQKYEAGKCSCINRFVDLNWKSAVFHFMMVLLIFFFIHRVTGG